jgi:hypothetical protein
MLTKILLEAMDALLIKEMMLELHSELLISLILMALLDMLQLMIFQLEEIQMKF